MKVLLMAIVVASVACATPSASEIVVPQDGVHVSGSGQAFVPAAPAGTCMVDDKGKTLNYFSSVGGPSGLDIVIEGYHGAGSYPMTKATALPATLVVYTQNAKWSAEDGTVAVLAVDRDGVIHGTANVPKASGGVPGRTSSIRGTWICNVQPVASPVPANG